MNDNHEEQVYSIKDVINSFDRHDIASKVFCVQNLDEQDTVYYQIKIKKFERNKEVHTMLQFTNISGSILYKLEKAHNQILEMINACVSHEMRNPLNSIMA